MNPFQAIREVLAFLQSSLHQVIVRIQAGDGFTISIVIALVSLILLLVLLSRRGEEVSAQVDRLGGVFGRLEKLEMNMNESRTQMFRTLELLKGDIGYLKQEIHEIRTVLKLPPSGSGGFGGGEPGAGGGGYSSSDEHTEEPSTQESKAEETSTDLSKGLAKTRLGLFERLRTVFSGRQRLDESTLDELEALLVGADLGIKVSQSLLNELRDQVKAGMSMSEDALITFLKSRILELLEKDISGDLSIVPKAKPQGPLVVMMVGVNGVGKTTSVAKLSAQWKAKGAKVIMVAADTFRAAAVEQLTEWGNRIGVPVVSGAPQAKPGTVVFDALQRAKTEGADVVIIDTAGRLHTKSNLMQELEGVRSIIKRFNTEAPHEVILVVDGATGQNAIVQAKEFNEAAPLTGIIVTKLDGTPKGGVVVAIKEELGIPVRYIGVGERAEDLRPFEARGFVEALFENNSASIQQDREIPENLTALM